jgi:hypothetical protein
MIEPSGGQRFAAQPLAGERVVLVARMQELDRDTALELRVFGEEDRSHAAGAKRRLDPIPARQQAHLVRSPPLAFCLLALPSCRFAFLRFALQAG